MHLVTALSNIAEPAEDGGDSSKVDERVEADYDDLGWWSGADGRPGVPRIGFDFVGRLAQAGFGQMVVDIDVVKSTTFRQSGVGRWGSVIFLFTEHFY